MEDYLGKNFFWWLDLLFSGWKNEHFFDWFQSKVKNYLLIQKDNSLTFFMRQKKERFFKIRHFLITGRVVLHKKFYKKFHLPVIKNGRLFRQKTSFGGWIYYSRGEKKWTFFRLISIEKVKNYLLIQKDNSLTFFMRQKEGNVFFKICHFLITGRVVLHKKFYKKNFIYQLSKMEDYLGKKTSFGGWIYYSRGEKMNIFSIDFNRKWRIIF